MVKLTKEQQKALARVYHRATSKMPSYLTFRRSVQPMYFGDGAVIVPWLGMWLAIEPDGYTHS